MERDHLAAVRPEHPQRIRVPQILLLGHREPGQVTEAEFAAGGDAGGPESFRLNPVEGEQAVDQGPEPLLLEPGALAAAFWPLSRRPAATVSLIRPRPGSWCRRKPAHHRTGRPAAVQLVELGRPAGSRTRPSMA